MPKDPKMLDDLARMAGGAVSTVAALRDEAEARVREQVERWAASMDLVRRDEFEAVQAQAVKARAENEALAKRLAALDKRLAALERGPRKAAAGGRRRTGKGAAKDA